MERDKTRVFLKHNENKVTEVYPDPRYEGDVIREEEALDIIARADYRAVSVSDNEGDKWSISKKGKSGITYIEKLKTGNNEEIKYYDRVGKTNEEAEQELLEIYRKHGYPLNRP